MIATIHERMIILYLKNKFVLLFTIICKFSALYSQDYINDLIQRGNQGDSKAQYELGILYLKGTNEVQTNFKKAILWLEKSPINKNCDVQYIIGKIYYDGRLGRRDHNTAFSWFKKSADQLYPKAIYKVADMYRLGEGTNYNVNAAYKYFKIGADLNDTLCIYELGICYEFGSGVNENQKEAYTLFSKAATYGLIDAEHKLAGMYELGVNEVVEKNCKIAIEKYTLCAKAGDRGAQFHLGEMHRSGRCDLKVDYKAALYWFEMCLQNNSGIDLESSAAFEAGKLYFLGNGVKKDKHKAAKLIKTAVNSGHIEATKFWDENNLQGYYKSE